MELAISLDESQLLPLYRQLYEGLRESILSGRLKAGHKLPSSRVLAARLNVSRNTVSQAYAELEAEGYLAGRHGSGTYVSGELPEESPLTSAVPVHAASANLPQRPSSAPRWLRAGRRPREVAAEPPAGLPYDFHPGRGAWDAFPREVWRRLLARQWRSGWQEAMDYGDPGGYRPLREELSAYLGRSRAVRCGPDEVVIVNGTQQALDLLARIILKPGDVVGIEDPGYPAAREVFASYGARFIPVPVDREGLVVERLQGSGAKLVLVSPSHQFPTGATLSLPRRLSLLAWARAEGGLVVEDDYDSEFRFEGRPLSSLQGLDGGGSVAYLGSFSKVLFPSLRVGYAVLPRDLVEPFEDAKELTDRQTPILEQQVLAGFLEEGHFERHLRKMRLLYQERRQALEGSLTRQLAGLVQVMGAKAGMHMMVRLSLPVDEGQVVARAAAAGVAVYPARPYYYGAPPGAALVLGYAGMPVEQIEEGVRRLAAVIRG